MRLPLRKVYRAFPELDRFTDEQCARLQLRAKRRSDDEPNYGCAMTFFVVFGTLFALAFLARLLAGTAAWKQMWRFRNRLDRLVSEYNWVEEFGGQLVLVTGAVVAGVGALWVRDRMLRRLMGDQIARTTCPKCRASLLGCQRSADSARCGSCGDVSTFDELGLDSEDLGPPLISLGAETTCGRCGYVIGGLPIYRGFVLCPECGKRTPVVQEGAPIGLADSIGAEER